MAELKTTATAIGVEDFLAAIQPLRRAEEGRIVAAMMARITGEPATMWGPSIVGFGRYRYKYDSGREGEMCRVGFSPRKPQLVFYLKLGDGAQEALLARLGKHSMGKGCLYVKKLADVDMTVLEALVAGAWAAMREAWPAG
jgi:hypothetical protein